PRFSAPTTGRDSRCHLWHIPMGLASGRYLHLQQLASGELAVGGTQARSSLSHSQGCTWLSLSSQSGPLPGFCKGQHGVQGGAVQEKPALTFQPSTSQS